MTDLGVLEKRPGQEELVLTSYFTDGERSPARSIDAVRKACGWELTVARDVRVEAAPTDEESAELRSLVG